MTKKESSLISIYKKNEFLIEDKEDIWISIENQIDSKYFRIPFAIITAWNPMNNSHSLESNIAMNKQLKEKIESLKYVYKSTVGKCDGHSEDSFIVYRLPKRLALELGREFKQYSIFYNDRCYLEYITCDDESILLQSRVANKGTINS